MTDPSHVVIVGAGLAGSRVATELRRLGFDGPVTLVGDEPHVPYDRPPLSKQVLSGKRTADDVVLLSREKAAEAKIELRLGERVTGVRSGSVTLADGELVEADAIVVATGVRARVPAGVCVGGRVHVLRTRDDSDRLARSLVEGNSLLVLGGGFIGAEVAATAVAAGVDVTLVEAQAELLAGALPLEVGHEVARLHREHGVTVRTGSAVESIMAHDDRVEARLADGHGTVLTADHAVVGFGTHLETGPLEGLPQARPEAGGPGLLCDADGRVTGVDGVYAAGDVAAWYDPSMGRNVRREHWSSASDQATWVAHTILGLEPPAFVTGSLPYFWSDQYDVKIQLVGRPGLARSGGWVPHEDGDRQVYGYMAGEELVAALTIGSPRLMMPLRKQLMANATARA